MRDSVTHMTPENKKLLQGHFRQMAKEQQRRRLFAAWVEFALATSTEAGWNEYIRSFRPVQKSS